MGIDAVITICVILLAIILFVTEYFSVDLIGLFLIAVLVISGVITPEQGVKGFANNATVTVAAMFILSASLIKTGVIETIAPQLSRLMDRGYKRSVAVMMVAVGSVSAFINNTPVIATMIPIISNSAQKTEEPPSKFSWRWWYSITLPWRGKHSTSSIFQKNTPPTCSPCVNAES